MAIFIRVLDGCFGLYRFSLEKYQQYFIIIAQSEPICSQFSTPKCSQLSTASFTFLLIACLFCLFLFCGCSFFFYWPFCCCCCWCVCVCVCVCTFKFIFIFPFFILCAVFISLRVRLGLFFHWSETRISYFGVVYKKFLSVGMEWAVINKLFIILYI